MGKKNGKPVVLRDGKPILFAGIQYWGLDHWNEGHWENDIEKIKDLGFNGVRLNIAWDHIEPKEGVFSFDQLDELFDQLDDAGLMVILQFNQSAHEWHPDWFLEKYTEKELLVKDEKGNNQYDRMTFSSPVLKEHYYNYVKQTISHFKERASIIGYSVYTEPHFADKVQWLDYNWNNKRAFKEWAEEKYQNITLLNEAWNTDYKSFSKVKPYTNTPPENWQEMPDNERKHFLDWSTWNCIAKARFIGDLIKECKEIDDQHFYIQNMMWKWSGAFAATVALDPVINYSYADVIGINTYPYEKNASKVGTQVNFIRSIFQNEKPVFLGEFNNKNGNATAQGLNDMVGEAFQAGCTGFVYFTYNGQAEKGAEEYGIEHYGLLDRNRVEKPSWYETKNFLQNFIVGQESNILNTPVVKAEVNYLWPSSNMRLAYLDAEYCYGSYVTARQWFYYDKGYNIDVVTEEQFRSGNFNKEIPLIIPSMPFTQKSTIKALAGYVKNDELKAVINGRFAEYIYEENAELKYQGEQRKIPYLDIEIDRFKEGKDAATLYFDQNFHKLNMGNTIDVAKDQIVFSSEADQNVIASWNDGTPALIERSFGKGKLLFYGTHLFHENPSKNSKMNGRLAKSFLLWAKGEQLVLSNKNQHKKKKKHKKKASF
ncbi:beta-galactosidase [Sediminitomix flava]|uniref:beta-galactosidase n=1 Tax=Sediminitomix flava TaxID=379075 RepID=UPI001304D522|nr:beta-galactosidase [Sediminitomix flava]